MIHRGLQPLLELFVSTAKPDPYRGRTGHQWIMVRDMMSWVRKTEVSKTILVFLALAASWIEVPFTKKIKSSVSFLEM